MKNKSIYWKWGLTVFLTVCAVLIFYDTFFLSGTLQKFLKKFFSVIAPLLNGLAMAYLLAPIVTRIEQWISLFAEMAGKKYPAKKTLSKRLQRGLAILITWVVVILLVYFLMIILIPQLVDSINILIGNARTYYNQVYVWAEGIVQKNPEIEEWFGSILNDYYNDALTFLTNKLLPWAQNMVTNLSGGLLAGIWNIVLALKDMIIGVIISVYILAMKEKSAARCCKLIYAFLKEGTAVLFIRALRRMNDRFSGFIRGKLLDSLIIGVICFIVCGIMKTPYTPLVSVVIGLTNIIPFFGPVLGAVPSAFLILLVSPLKCLYFVIFVILLQQLDGNVIGPRILGETTGISSFWVVVAILIGGGFGGILGMVVGVPICACIQDLVKYLMNRRLAGRGMSTDAFEYVERDKKMMKEGEETPPQP